jgi:hypothetical protein
MRGIEKLFNFVQGESELAAGLELLLRDARKDRRVGIIVGQLVVENYIEQ